MMKKALPYFFIILFALFLYLPVILKPDLLVGRNNDLNEFFGSIIQFIKNQILTNRQFPLWNNLFLAGTPLLPDPQSQLFYLPNIIFALLPVGTGFLISFLAHLAWAGVGTFLSAKRLFKSPLSYYLASFVYMSSALFWGALQAGHFGLFNAYAWLPWVLFGIISNSFLLVAFSLAMVFFSHPIIFFLTIALLLLMFISFKTLRPTVLKGTFLSLGLTAISLLPQLKWVPQTTRNLLIEIPDVYPKWHGLREFVLAAFLPNLGDEKRIFLGIGVLALCLFGFFKLSKKLRVVTATIFFGAILVSANNASPIVEILIKLKTFALLRVATRVWFFVPLFASFLAAYGFEKLFSSQKKNFVRYLVFVFVLLEVTIAFSKGVRAEIKTRAYAPKAVYEFLAKDGERFRVFCTSRCLSQKDASKVGLELLDGYATLIQKNFYTHSWELTNSYWNYYSLSVPPVGTYEFEELQPSAASLGEYNVKYVISLHKLTDKNFELVETIDDYLIYENTLNHPRAYYLNNELKPLGEAKILSYSPNLIRIATEGNPSTSLVLAEVFSPGWKAYVNGKNEVPVLERPNALRYVSFGEGSSFVEFRYAPPGYKTGRTITLFAIAFAIIFSLKGRLKKLA